MTSEVGIYNMALARIGIDRTVAAIGENSKEARNCTRAYAHCRDEVLEAMVWPFAVKTAALATVAVAGTLQGWGGQFAKPADALRILEVTSEGDASSSYNYWCNCAGPWSACARGASSFRESLAADGGSTLVLSNVPAPYAVYVARVTNASVFTPLMVSVLADRLAMEIAMPITQDKQMLQMAMQRYNLSFATAAASALEQSKDGPDDMPPSLRARY